MIGLWPWLAGYLVVANTVAFVLFGLDKRRAREGSRRISERTLVISALVSGTIGGWLGMLAFRHKTAKRSFQLKMAAASVIDIAVLVALAAFG